VRGTHLIDPRQKFGGAQKSFVHARWRVGIHKHLKDVDIGRDEFPSQKTALIPLADDIRVEMHDFEQWEVEGGKNE